MMKLRIALVQYLNSAPLGWGFSRGPQREQLEVQLCTPAECADRLRDGVVEAGLIPVAEYQRIGALRVVPGISIATQGRARSVLLVGRVPAPKMRSVALDSSSRTSALLVQILLSEWFDVRPKFLSSSLDMKSMLGHHDGALIIGDRALCSRLQNYYVYDLGEYWVRMTGLPFVFAFWVCRSGAPEASQS
jgi:chorismate dehydratase